MLLRHAGISYVDRLYSQEEWAKVKNTMPEGKGCPGVCTRPAGMRGLPVLELESGEMMPETTDIACFIARESPLAFPTLTAEKAAEAYEMTLAANTYPLLFSITLLAAFPEEDAEAILRGELPETLHGPSADLPRYSEVLPTLQRWEARLGEDHFFGGEVPHYGEFSLFTVVDALHHVDPQLARQIGSALQDWFVRMAKLPAVRGYLEMRAGGGTVESQASPGSILYRFSEPALRWAARGGS